MSVNKNELVQWIGQLETLKGDVPEIMGKIAVGEGVYAVKQARRICTDDMSEPKRQKTGVVNTGAYRRNWKADKTARRSGRKFIVRFYNGLDYASHLEYGVTLSPATGKAIPSSTTGTTRKAECSSARRAATSGDTSP